MSAPHHKLPDAEKAIPAFLAAFGKVKEVMPIREPGGEPPMPAFFPGSPYKHTRIDEIAELMRALTYGEMIELSSAVCEAAKLASLELTEQNLPGILHRWSTGNARIPQIPDTAANS